jgi:1-phosphofructokinase family hexose kinase
MPSLYFWLLNMILCVTPNPAIDRTLLVRGHAQGGTLRTQETVVVAGGKGLNVARTVKLLGGTPLCAGFLGGHSGGFIADYVRDEGMANAWTWLKRGESRSCIILVDPETGHTAVINETGPQLIHADWKQFEGDILKAAASIQTICFCGSVPPSPNLTLYEDVLSKLVAAGKSVWVDTSGDSLRIAASVKGVRLKVNSEEAGEMLDMFITSVESAAEAAQKLAERTSAPTALTMGAIGAVYTDGQQVWYANPPEVQVKNVVGSGDAFLAALLVALEKGDSAGDALKQAVAVGAAKAAAISTNQFSNDDIQRILSDTQLRMID